MSDIRLAIVGSTSFAEPLALDFSMEIIEVAIIRLEPEAIISGGAKGIDTLAKQVAANYGYRVGDGFVEHLPASRRWEPDGYKARNLAIVEDCTHLLAIRCHASKTYGSGWTADQAQRAGKHVIRAVL